MYSMNADEARALMLETEAEIIALLRRFEAETGLAVADIDITYSEPKVGDSSRFQPLVRQIALRPVLT